MKKIELNLSSEIYNQLEKLASANKKTIPEYIQELLNKFLEKSSDLSDSKFRKVMDEVISKNDDLLRRLADK